MKGTIKELLLKYNVKPEDGEDDFNPNIYAAAEALVRSGQQSIVQANAALIIKAQEESQMAMYKATQRQNIATQCLQGLLAADLESEWMEENVVAAAVQLADALITELDKDVEP